jgi:hypothetical protein
LPTSAELGLLIFFSSAISAKNVNWATWIDRYPIHCTNFYKLPYASSRERLKCWFHGSGRQAQVSPITSMSSWIYIHWFAELLLRDGYRSGKLDEFHPKFRNSGEMSCIV